MLEAIRKRTGSIVVKGLAAILIISFGAWGIGDFIQSGVSEDIVAEVGELQITPMDVENEIDREIARFQRQSGMYLDRQQLKAFGLGEKLIQRLINSAVLDLEAENLELTVTETRLAKNIQANPAFSGITGIFDKNRFDQVIRSEGFTESNYISEISRELVRGQLLSNFDKIIFPKIVAEDLYKIQNEKRIAKTMFFSDSGQKDIKNPGNEDLLSFYNARKQMFTAPETRNISYILISVDQLSDEIAVSEKEILSYFEDNQDDFYKPEMRHIHQFVLSDEDAVDKAQTRLSAGIKFVDIAREIAGTRFPDLDLGMLAKGDLPFPEVADAAFELEEPGLAKIVKSPVGFHFVEVVKIKAAEQRTIVEARQEIVSAIQDEKGIDRLYQVSNQMEDVLGSGASLEEAAREIGTTVRNLRGLSKAGHTLKAGQKIDIPSFDTFIDIAFSTDLGMESLLTEAGQDGYFILRVDDIVERALKPFENISDEVKSAWVKEARIKKSKAAASQTIEQITNTQPFEQFAKSINKNIEIIGPITRVAQEKYEASVLAEIFSLKVHEVGIARVDNGYQVIQLQSIEVPDPNIDYKGVNKIVSELKSSFKNDLVAQYADALRARYGVNINRTLVDLIFQPGGYRANRS